MSFELSVMKEEIEKMFREVAGVTWVAWVTWVTWVIGFEHK